MNWLWRTWEDLTEEEKLELRTPPPVAKIDWSQLDSKDAPPAGNQNTVSAPESSDPPTKERDNSEERPAAPRPPRSVADPTSIPIVAGYALLVALLAFAGGRARNRRR